MNPKSRPSLTTRLVRAGIAGLTSVVAIAGLATGCLDRPVSPAVPATTNIVVEKIRQDRVDKIDLLFMIDNSISMADKQQILKAAVPQLVRRLVQPICVDAAGIPNGEPYPCANSKPEFEPVLDIHVGVITSSLGGHGGNVCADDAPGNDRAHLLPDVRPADGLPTDGAGYLWWHPADETQITEAAVTDFAGRFQLHVEKAGESGCGFEATLESWYRFLADPEPPSSVSNQNGTTVAVRGPCGSAEADPVICQQRAEFLRPNSLVAIVMMSDENDCSIRDSDVGWYVSTIVTPQGAPYPLAKPTAACASDPNSPDCRSCAETPTPAGCDGTSLDPASTDKVNLRCFDQKRRFGIDFLYPTTRYVNALKQKALCPQNPDLAIGADGKCPGGADPVPNPLYIDLSGAGTSTRDNQLVFLAGIVGVPWQDIATDDTLDPNVADLRYRTSAQLADRWGWITGDSINPPADPLMVESPDPRGGTHPLGNAAFDPKPDTSPPGANAINGHEWQAGATPQGDLQYACIFPLTQTRDCSTITGSGCDCKTGTVGNNPLCQDQAGNYGTTQYHAKAYPGLRELGVLRDYGDNSIVASICPKITDSANPSYGYNPAVAAIIDRLKEALGGKCLPRTIAVDEQGNVPCKVLEATLQGGGCTCDTSTGRIALTDPSVEGGADLDAAVKAQLLKDNHCSNSPATPPLCSDYCVCLVQEYAEPTKATCQNEATFVADAGWCYVDPLPPPLGQSLGSEEVVAQCDASEKRLLRFEPVAGAIAYIACQGAPFSGEGVQPAP